VTVTASLGETPPVLAERMRQGQRAQIYHRALIAEVDKHSWARRRRRRAYRGAADWQAHVSRTREAFTRAIGALPERTPLHVTTTGVLSRDGYAVEKLLIETQPGFLVTANVYLPTRAEWRARRLPGVLNAVGHWPDSKGQDVEQARCAALARKGYVALIWDPLGQGERSQYRRADGLTPWAAPGTSEHAAVGNTAVLLGTTVVAAMLWDGVRLLDYLAARPEVDSERLACTGVSGGGTYTTFLGLFDRRLKATVPVCSTASLERMHRSGQIGEACQDVRRAYLDNLETADLLLAHAPAALRIIGTRYDIFRLAGLYDAFLDVQDGYTGLGHPDRTDLCIVDAHHEYNQTQRELLYGWLNRWLDHDAPVPEEPFTPEDPSTLWCTPTGQLLTAGLANESSKPSMARTALDLLRALAACGPSPITGSADSAPDGAGVHGALRDAVRRVLGPLPSFSGAPPISLPPAAVDGMCVERVILQGTMDVPLPGLLFHPPERASAAARLSAAILVDDAGRETDVAPGGLARSLAHAGVRALAIDLRGWGETAWVEPTYGWSLDRQDILSADNMLFYVAYALGTCPVAQRVHDLLAALEWLRARPDVDARRVALVGTGGGGIVALHAAVLDGGVRAVVCRRTLATYRSVVEAPRYAHPVADFVPGALRTYDLPDLAAALAPAPVLLDQPLDALGAPLHDGAIEERTAADVADWLRAALVAGNLGGHTPAASSRTMESMRV
jgi:dienelactone hydrolase